MIREQGLTFRPDWEAVVTPVVDFATTLSEVDAERLALMGMSLGGYLAPRAAASEPRIKALVAFDGVYDIGVFAESLRAIGTDVFADYRLRDVAGLITAPTLVLEAEHDHFFTGQPDLLFNALTCPKRIVRFTAEEGAEEHCHMGNMSLFHQRVFDWLDETLPG